MRIRINPYDQRSIDEALKMVREYQSTFGKKIETLCERLAEIGADVAKVQFMRADYDGTNDVKVAHWQEDGKFKIVAYGKATMFIEFGTGIKFNPQGNDSYPGQRPQGVVGIGEYGKGHGATGHRWYYDNGKYSYGNPPAMAMYRAEQEVIAAIIRIAREVFND